MKRIRFWGTRGSLPVALTAPGVRAKDHRCAARRRGSHVRIRCGDRALRRCIAVRGRGHVRRPHGLRGDRDRRVGIRGLRPRQRRCGRSARRRSRGTARRLRRPITCSCRTCTGITSWACRFSCPAYIPGNRLLFYGGTASSKRRCGDRWNRRRFRSISRVQAPTSSSSTSSPARRTTSPDARHGEAAAPCAATRTAIASSATAAPSSTRPTPSTSSTTRPRAPRFAKFFRDADVVDLRRDVLARRSDLGQGGLGPFEQHRRRRAVPARRAPSICACSITSRRSTTRRSRVLEETRRYEEITRTGARRCA